MSLCQATVKFEAQNPQKENLQSMNSAEWSPPHVVSSVNPLHPMVHVVNPLYGTYQDIVVFVVE